MLIVPVSGLRIFVTGDGSVQTKVYIFIVGPLGQLLAWRQYNTVRASFGQAQLSVLDRELGRVQECLSL